MSYYAYLFLPEKLDLKRAESPLIKWMAYWDEHPQQLPEYPFWACSTNDLHGGGVLDSFTEKPKPLQEFRKDAENIWANYEEGKRQANIEREMELHEQAIELYQNEPKRWLDFFHDALKSIPRIAFLITWEGSDKKDDHLYQERISKPLNEIDESFFRSVKEEILYDITR